MVEKKQEEDMSCVEAVEQMAKAVLGSRDKVISMDEYNELISQAHDQEERDLYTELYNYLLKKKQRGLVENGVC